MYKACTKQFPVYYFVLPSCLETFEKERFCSFPIDTATRLENQRLEMRHVGAAKRAFRARQRLILTLSARWQTGWNVTKCHAATQNDMTTCLETFEKEVCSLPHRHGDVSRKPDTRDETRGRSKTSISCETSSNFDTFGNAFGKNLSSALLLDSFQHMTWDLRVHAGTSCKRRQLSMGQEPQEVILFSECFKTKYRFSEGA